jgi:hypothetical protein
MAGRWRRRRRNSHGPAYLFRATRPERSQAFCANASRFMHAAVAYSALFETALRLYLPPLRTLSTQHLKAHVIGAHTTNALASGRSPESSRKTVGIALASARCAGWAPAPVLPPAKALWRWHARSERPGWCRGRLPRPAAAAPQRTRRGRRPRRGSDHSRRRAASPLGARNPGRDSQTPTR